MITNWFLFKVEIQEIHENVLETRKSNNGLEHPIYGKKTYTDVIGMSRQHTKQKKLKTTCDDESLEIELKSHQITNNVFCLIEDLIMW